MRGLGVGQEHERGASAILVAILLVVLLGFTALVVDVGRLYAEEAQLQNGADAASLAIAESCARGSICDQSRADLMAVQYANGNANDGVSAVISAPLGHGQVTVNLTSQNLGASSGELPLLFAPVFELLDPARDYDSAIVSASATATWGGPYSGTPFVPVAFGRCEFDLSGSLRMIQTHGSNDCSSRNPSGASLPGGFGWLTTDGTCHPSLLKVSDTEFIADSSTGAPPPNGCDGFFNKNKLQGKTVIIPVFDYATGTGSSGTFVIKGWAAFELWGWNLPSAKPDAKVDPPAGMGYKVPGSNSTKGLIGRFVKFVATDPSLTLGGTDAFGTSIIRLTK
ncbi:Tad domain-containing protein [Arthrobacter crystallopoietes]|uniref:Tad domain-containing protein n=1 Tax=Crystallibacter crystallopoietes TaxID=37928 RepID=UPI003D1D7FA8